MRRFPFLLNYKYLQVTVNNVGLLQNPVVLPPLPLPQNFWLCHPQNIEPGHTYVIQHHFYCVTFTSFRFYEDGLFIEVFWEYHQEFPFMILQIPVVSLSSKEKKYIGYPDPHPLLKF